MFDPMESISMRTTTLYNAIKSFSDTRAEARQKFLDTMKRYEQDKGSNYYSEREAEARKERAAAVDTARAAAWDTVSSTLMGMSEHAGKRKMSPPSEEMLRILQVLQMRQNVTQAELMAAANAMDGNGAGLAVIQEIANKSGNIHINFNAMAKTDLATEATDAAIKGLYDSCKRILNGTGANRAAEQEAKRNASMYGNPYDSDDLPQEAAYQSEQDFYSRNMSIPYQVFADAVNGKD